MISWLEEHDPTGGVLPGIVMAVILVLVWKPFLIGSFVAWDYFVQQPPCESIYVETSALADYRDYSREKRMWLAHEEMIMRIPGVETAYGAGASSTYTLTISKASWASWDNLHPVILEVLCDPQRKEDQP